LAAYLQDENYYLHLNDFYQQKRDLFLKGLEASKFTFKPSAGTYFQLLDYSTITDEHDEDFAKRLITDYKLASIPISSFNTKKENNMMLRFCFAKKRETLEEALDILNRI
jgi:methionine aminotransferase